MKKFFVISGFIVTIVSVILIVLAFLKSTKNTDYSEDYEWGI